MTRRRIPEAEWQWFGSPGHLIVSDSCRFHLVTKVGDYIVSTIGDYYQPGAKKNPTEIGSNRLFETMVFPVGGACECGCGMPNPSSWSEIDMDSYMTRDEANRGHRAMCEKWARPVRARREVEA